MTDDKRHPIQRPCKDANGVIRFTPNNIVRWLLDAGDIDLNDIAIADFCREDREQFAQLIGYSLGGFGELDYVSGDTYDTAEAMVDGTSERTARLEMLQGKLDAVRNVVRPLAAGLFDIHPDDLGEPND